MDVSTITTILMFMTLIDQGRRKSHDLMDILPFLLFGAAGNLFTQNGPIQGGLGGIWDMLPKGPVSGIPFSPISVNNPIESPVFSKPLFNPPVSPVIQPVMPAGATPINAAPTMGGATSLVNSGGIYFNNPATGGLPTIVNPAPSPIQGSPEWIDIMNSQ